MLPLLWLLAAAPAQALTRAQYVMGTVCEITAAKPSAVSAAFAEIARWDAILSLYKKESQASRLNASSGRPFPASADLWEAVSLSLRLARASGGAFDPTVFSRDGAVGHKKIRLLPDRKVLLPPGASLDFGGIGKGLALDHAARVFKEHGVSEALINFGGQIYALGGPWRVAVPGYGELPVKNASVSTSGDCERPGHIVSPFTGRAVLGPPVTVIAAAGASADAWSTALYVLGRSGFFDLRKQKGGL